MSDRYRKKAWLAGRSAALDGRRRDTNNRQQGTIFWDDWHDGYNDGERELLEQQTLRAIVPTPTNPDSGGGMTEVTPDRKEIERLRKALREIVAAPMIDHSNPSRSAQAIAKAALATPTNPESDHHHG